MVLKTPIVQDHKIGVCHPISTEQRFGSCPPGRVSQQAGDQQAKQKQLCRDCSPVSLPLVCCLNIYRSPQIYARHFAVIDLRRGWEERIGSEACWCSQVLAYLLPAPIPFLKYLLFFLSPPMAWLCHQIMAPAEALGATLISMQLPIWSAGLEALSCCHKRHSATGMLVSVEQDPNKIGAWLEMPKTEPKTFNLKSKGFITEL